jgi:molybdopterin biosynthesis enzyme
MDGYVVREDALPGSFFVAGEIPAGAIPGQVLQPGECYRIFTGALLPEGGGRVIMQEEMERALQGGQTPQQALTNTVTRGNVVLRNFERSNRA